MKTLEKEKILGINTSGELLDPRFDYVFKRIFTASEEQSKIALINFLNSILFDGKEKIKDLTIVNNDKNETQRFVRRVIPDKPLCFCTVTD